MTPFELTRAVSAYNKRVVTANARLAIAKRALRTLDDSAAARLRLGEALWHANEEHDLNLTALMIGAAQRATGRPS